MLNGMQIIARNDSAIYLRIPKELQQSAGPCDCSHCKGQEGFWDTLGVPLATGLVQLNAAWTLHWPVPPVMTQARKKGAR
jgi:hypothetical protein